MAVASQELAVAISNKLASTSPCLICSNGLNHQLHTYMEKPSFFPLCYALIQILSHYPPDVNQD